MAYLHEIIWDAGFTKLLDWWWCDLLTYKPGMFWDGAEVVVDVAFVGWVEEELVSKIGMETQISD